MAKTYLLLGGNMGNREMFLGKARQKIAELIGDPVKISSVFETEPWGVSHKTPFLNQLVIAETRLEPEEVMQTILKIENQLGRVRGDKKYASRTIDIDILFYDDRLIHENELIIPHPELHKRRFALEPLAELEPMLVHPLKKKSVARLLVECKDTMNVSKL